MIFFDALAALWDFNIGFFADVVLNNLVWVFAFLVVNHVLFKGKQLFFNFALFSVYIWSFRDFGALWGLGGFAINPFVFFVLMVFWRIFVLDKKLFGKHTGALDVIWFYALVVLLNFFIR